MKSFTLLELVIVSSSLVFEVHPSLAVNTCSWGQFQCDNRRCIKSTFRCDKDNDCDDNSDERGCGEECRNKYFRCKNGNCISRMHMCEGDDDCDDGSDETAELCGSGSAPMTCFHCNATGSLPSNCSDTIECSRSLGFTRCARLSYERNGTNVIESTCVRKSNCTPEGIRKYCDKRGGAGCKMQCCARNRCNPPTSFDNRVWSPHLACYECSINNWQSCKNKVTCSGNEGYDRCYRMTYNHIQSGKISRVVRTGCANQGKCTGKNTLCTGDREGTNCKLDCCKSTSCSVPKIDPSPPPLTCYECSIHNWQTCNNKITCSGNEGYDRCYRMTYNRIESGEEYRVTRTGCATLSNCTGANTLCVGHDGANCELKCCENSSCNVPKNDGTSSKPHIKCYKCTSMKSYADCDQRKLLQTCSDKEDRCYAAQAITDNKNDDGVSRMFHKGCTLANNCSSTTLDVCKNSTSCTVKCCTGDGCNTALSLLVSRFVLMACVIYAYVFIGLPV